MIEVNLLPGGGRRAGRRVKLTRFLPRFSGSMPRVDRWTAYAGLAVGMSLLGILWLFFAVAGQAEELEVRIEAAASDSIRLADMIERSQTLQARRDSIARRVEIIQGIDGDRYLWPHVMDEVARALPDFTWMMRLSQVSGGGGDLVFQIDGAAGTYFALTTFMENLEASPFIRGVRLIGSDQTSISGADGAETVVHQFILQASTQEPPAGVIESVPLFGPLVVPPSGEEES